MFALSQSEGKLIYPNLIFSVFCSSSRSHERTQEELELVFEELLHIHALSHLSTSIKRELASIIVFESHAQAGTVRELNAKHGFIGFHYRFNL
jgi:hypothetical protein